MKAITYSVFCLLLFALCANNNSAASASIQYDPKTCKQVFDALPFVHGGKLLCYLCIGYQKESTERETQTGKDNHGRSWVHKAAMCGHAIALHQAVHCGISVTDQDNYGNTPLHLTVHAPNTVTPLRVLLEHYDGMIDIMNHRGMTPLTHMALFNKPTAMAELLWRGANPQHIIAPGVTIAGLALAANNENCGVLLQRCINETRPGTSFRIRLSIIQSALEESEYPYVPEELLGLIISLTPCDVRNQEQPNA